MASRCLMRSVISKSEGDGNTHPKIYLWDLCRKYKIAGGDFDFPSGIPNFNTGKSCLSEIQSQLTFALWAERQLNQLQFGLNRSILSVGRDNNGIWYPRVSWGISDKVNKSCWYQTYIFGEESKKPPYEAIPAGDVRLSKRPLWYNSLSTSPWWQHSC